MSKWFVNNLFNKNRDVVFQKTKMNLQLMNKLQK